MDIWIFECNEETQWECFSTNLFGAKARWPLQVKAGNLCLLYNYTRGSEHNIFKIFRALSDGAKNIKPDAWGGDYPYQVRVALASRERLAVPRINLKRLITEVRNDVPRVRNHIYGDPAQDLLQFYAASYTLDQHRGERLQIFDDDFRLKFPRQHHCVDGHDVRSLSEQAICDWLSRNHVYH